MLLIVISLIYALIMVLIKKLKGFVCVKILNMELARAE